MFLGQPKLETDDIVEEAILRGKKKVAKET
jgi:hypothetical protein